MPGKAKWTVLTFIAAHNNLQAYGEKSLREILDVGSTNDVALGAFFDGKKGAGLYTMGINTPGVVEHQQLLGNFDSGDPAGVVAAAKWLFEKYPAERYGLVLWSHGTGWEPSEIEQVAKEVRPADALSDAEKHERSAAPGRQVLFRSTLRAMLQPAKPSERAILFDDGTGHSLDTVELGNAIADIAAVIGQPLDLLGMDACLMANVEVGWQLREHLRYLVASQELVPGHSWPYGKIYGQLIATPTMNAATLAKLIVDEYVAYYTANPPGAGDVTKVALDLSRIDELRKAADEFAGAVLEDIDAQARPLAAAQIAARMQESRKGLRQPTKFDFHLWDLGTLARQLASQSPGSPVAVASAKLVQALKPGAGTVLAEGHVGAWFDGLGGVTVYLPMHPAHASRHYADLGFAQTTRWPKMLAEYRDYFPP